MVCGPAKIFRSAVERHEESKKLPLGHYERLEAEKALEAEYAECVALERKLYKHYKRFGGRRLLSLGEAARLVGEVCSRVGVKLPRQVYLKSDRVPPGAYGCYFYNEIHFRYDTAEITAVLHEIAHRVVSAEGLRGLHDKDFLWAEEMLFEAAYQYYKELDFRE